MIDELRAFLEARLDEDEQTARAAARTDDGRGGQWTPVALQSTYDARVDDHIARHDPARMLREVEAKRRVVERYKRATAIPEASAVFERGQDDGYRQGCLDAIKDAAEVYAEHPDCRQE